MNTRNPRIVYLDTETTGLDERYDEAWEVAWIEEDLKTGEIEEHEMFVKHNNERAKKLPEPFKSDYYRRFDAGAAITRAELAERLTRAFRKRDGAATHLVGQVPSFDTARLGQVCRGQSKQPPWYYQIHDLETAAIGYVQGRLRFDESLGWSDRRSLTALLGRLHTQGKGIKSDDLSRALGVDPAGFDRHTALGDCRWTRAQWRVIFGPAQRWAGVVVDPIFEPGAGLLKPSTPPTHITGL